MSRRNRASGPKKPELSSFRIIAGNWRGRRLSYAAAEGLRPTHDRVRETLFNWLGPDVEGCRCLDLFAGSGALGLEAASRGAGSVDIVDISSRVIASLREQLTTFPGSEVVHLHQMPAESFLTSAQISGSAETYDLVFLDPPFGHSMLQGILRHPDFCRLITPETLLYIEHEKGEDISAFTEVWKQKTTASLVYGLYYLTAAGVI